MRLANPLIESPVKGSLNFDVGQSPRDYTLEELQKTQRDALELASMQRNQPPLLGFVDGEEMSEQSIGCMVDLRQRLRAVRTCESLPDRAEATE